MTIDYNNNAYLNVEFVVVRNANRLIDYDTIKKYLPLTHKYIKSSDIKKVVKRNTSEHNEAKEEYKKIYEDNGIALKSVNGIDFIHTTNYNPIIFGKGSILFSGISVYNVETGNRTGNGELHKNGNSKYLSACNILPFGTIIKITNLSNDKSVKVTITDRGNFGPGNKYQDVLVDVSLKVFEVLTGSKMGFIDKAMIEIIELGDNYVYPSNGSKDNEIPTRDKEPTGTKNEVLPPLKYYKPEPDNNRRDKTNVKVDYGELILKDAGVNKDMLEKIKSGEIVAAGDTAKLSPGPNAKQQTPVNNKKINIDKQVIPVG